jgi:hypothetical protein
MTNLSLFVQNGKNLILSRLFASSVTVVSQFQVGTGTTTPTEVDTGLTTPVGSKYNFSGGYPIYDTTNSRATIRGLVPAADLAGNTLAESGLFNTDGTPVLLNHDTWTGFAKTTSKQLIMNWIIKVENVN